MKIKSLDEDVTAQYVERQVKVAVGKTPGVQGKQEVETAVRNQLQGKAARLRASHSAPAGPAAAEVYVPET